MLFSQHFKQFFLVQFIATSGHIKAYAPLLEALALEIQHLEQQHSTQKYAFENIKYATIEAPNEVKACIEEIIEDNNPVKAFINEFYYISTDEKDKVSLNEFYNHFNTENKDAHFDNKQVCAAMRHNNFTMSKIKGNRYWQKLKKKNEDELDDD